MTLCYFADARLCCKRLTDTADGYAMATGFDNVAMSITSR